VRKLQQGFTLIELMIVIAIIAILAAILIPNFLHARAESQTAACEGNEKQLATAMEEYAVDHNGTYPGTLGSAGLTTPYLNFTPTDPVSGSAYVLTNVQQVNGYGSYEINDVGAHDPTTTTGLHLSGSGTTLCTACVSVIYMQAGGIVGQN
jgi:prepilin-type N-terminal cleavage/methylation domain-containing protein